VVDGGGVEARSEEGSGEGSGLEELTSQMRPG